MEETSRLSTEIPAERQLRADARRNRARVLAAAEAVFAEVGVHAGIELIAHRAGVGVGTVCRNFATKEDLIAEVLLGGEVPAHGADPDAGPVGDELDPGVDPVLGEDLLGGGEHARPVAAGIGAKLPLDGDLG